MNIYERLENSDFATEKEIQILDKFEIGRGESIQYNATALEHYLKTVIVTDAGLFLKHIENDSQDEFITSIRHEFERATDPYSWGYCKRLNAIHRLRKMGYIVEVER